LNSQSEQYFHFVLLSNDLKDGENTFRNQSRATLVVLVADIVRKTEEMNTMLSENDLLNLKNLLAEEMEHKIEDNLTLKLDQISKQNELYMQQYAKLKGTVKSLRDQKTSVDVNDLDMVNADRW